MSERVRGTWFSFLLMATYVNRQMLKRMSQEDLEFEVTWGYTFCVELSVAWL